MNVCRHRPNGLGARDEYGRIVCAQCGNGYDEDTPKTAPPMSAVQFEQHLEQHMRGMHGCPGPFIGEHHDQHHKTPGPVGITHVHHVQFPAGTELGVDLALDDGSWFKYVADSPVVGGSIDRVGVLPNATTGGHPALQLLITLDDGTKVVAQTTWHNFSLAMVALIARWGTP